MSKKQLDHMRTLFGTLSATNRKDFKELAKRGDAHTPRELEPFQLAYFYYCHELNKHEQREFRYTIGLPEPPPAATDVGVRDDGAVKRVLIATKDVVSAFLKMDATNQAVTLKGMDENGRITAEITRKLSDHEARHKGEIDAERKRLAKANERIKQLENTITDLGKEKQELHWKVAGLEEEKKVTANRLANPMSKEEQHALMIDLRAEVDPKNWTVE